MGGRSPTSTLKPAEQDSSLKPKPKPKSQNPRSTIPRPRIMDPDPDLNLDLDLALSGRAGYIMHDSHHMDISNRQVHMEQLSKIFDLNLPQSKLLSLGPNYLNKSAVPVLHNQERTPTHYVQKYNLISSGTDMRTERERETEKEPDIPEIWIEMTEIADW
ncbi:hypothetical protein HYC85_011985 [Camellia sinensis]|uniref:Uncharacterized protein n=1 Tax=Camellia sinensis TaxID=4442 RepID=A0A7J7HAM6_CAMSI|nr:hypothetical protein HYC85_011985 [Camellia sinensis]